MVGDSPLEYKRSSSRYQVGSMPTVTRLAGDPLGEGDEYIVGCEPSIILFQRVDPDEVNRTFYFLTRDVKQVTAAGR